MIDPTMLTHIHRSTVMCEQLGPLGSIVRSSFLCGWISLHGSQSKTTRSFETSPAQSFMDETLKNSCTTEARGQLLEEPQSALHLAGGLGRQWPQVATRTLDVGLDGGRLGWWFGRLHHHFLRIDSPPNNCRCFLESLGKCKTDKRPSKPNLCFRV